MFITGFYETLQAMGPFALYAGVSLALAIVILPVLFASRVVSLARARSAKVPLPNRPVRTLVFLGSGGHTKEMIDLASDFILSTTRYLTTVVVSETASVAALCVAVERAIDARRAEEAKFDDHDAGRGRGSAAWREVEEHLERFGPPKRVDAAAVRARFAATSKAQPVPLGVVVVARARSVHQPWLGSALSAARSFADCVALCVSSRPQLVLAGGPGTAVPLVAAARLVELWRALFTGSDLSDVATRVVFVESFSRVRGLSLTGKALERAGMLDKLVVAWDTAQQGVRSRTYLGWLF